MRRCLYPYGIRDLLGLLTDLASALSGFEFGKFLDLGIFKDPIVCLVASRLAPQAVSYLESTADNGLFLTYFQRLGVTFVTIRATL